MHRHVAFLQTWPALVEADQMKLPGRFPGPTVSALVFQIEEHLWAAGEGQAMLPFRSIRRQLWPSILIFTGACAMSTGVTSRWHSPQSSVGYVVRGLVSKLGGPGLASNALSSHCGECFQQCLGLPLPLGNVIRLNDVLHPPTDELLPAERPSRPGTCSG